MTIDGVEKERGRERSKNKQKEQKQKQTKGVERATLHSSCNSSASHSFQSLRYPKKVTWL